jgi:acyl-CoA thioesterase
MTPEEVARKSVAALWTEDHTAKEHGIHIESVGPGRAALSMTLTKAMTNGYGIGHGGFIFLLADTAFAYACNSYNQRCVAQHCAITYLRPAKQGSRLRAEARELQRVDRSGIYDITVTDESGAAIAEFRGYSRTVPGSLF